MRARTFLMFTGQAEEALRHYEKALPALVVESVTRHPEGGELAGKILTAQVRLGTHELMFHDSPPVHAFTFTPSISLFVDVTAQDFEEAVRHLSDGGAFLMPPDNYGFSRRFAWVQDKFGVSWQINLP
jgi:predicted 3-demethylubiquinone-9 3-methyltransferase (glyoxalase superfamily)